MQELKENRSPAVLVAVGPKCGTTSGVGNPNLGASFRTDLHEEPRPQISLRF